MKRVIGIALVAFLVVGGAGHAEEKKPARAPLPREDSVKWDVARFEESATFALAKREVKNGELVWVLENRKDLPMEIVIGYRADFLDEDGVKLFGCEITSQPFPANLRLGERNRFILVLPRAEHWKNVRTVVIRGG